MADDASPPGSGSAGGPAPPGGFSNSASALTAGQVLGPLPGTVSFFPFVGGVPGAPLQLPLQLIAQQQVVQEVQVWQGPFPPPDAVEHYERVQPGTFNRMLTMAEQAQTAQVESLKRAQDFQRRDMRRAHLLGWSTTVLAMIGAGFCAWRDQAALAAVFLGVPVMAVAKALIESARGGVRPVGNPSPSRDATDTGADTGKSDPS